jgi:hypothetical protein
VSDPGRMSGRQRRFFTREPPRNAVPVPHVSLGRLWSRRSAMTRGLHVVVEVDGKWQALCTGSPAVRSYKGRPGQASCEACKAAHEPVDGAA